MTFRPPLLDTGRLSLAWKFSLAALLIIVSMGTVVYFIADTTIRKNLYDSHRQKGEAIVSNLASNAVDPLLLDNIARLQLLLKNAEQSNSEIVYIFIVGPKGEVSAHTFPGGFPSDLKKIPNPVDGQSYGSRFLDIGRNVVLDIAVPVLQGSLGYAHAGFSLGMIDLQRKHSQWQIFWACFWASFLAIIIAVLFSRRITKPLMALAQGADYIGRGNFAHRLDIVGPAEIGVTAKAFNHMAESLQNDIAERMKMEKALRESEEIYRNLVENIDMGITLIDHNQTILKANAAHGRLFNKTPSEFYGKKCFEEFRKRDSVCLDCPGVTAMKSGSPSESIVQVKRDDGSMLTLNIKAFPVKGESGRCEQFIEVAEDISEQLRMQQELAAEKERLSVTLRSIGDGVITTDLSGNIILLNKIAEDLTGWNHEEAKGRPLEEVFHIIDEQTREVCENPASKVVNSGKIIGMAKHIILVARDGTERSIADSGAPIRDAQGKIVGVVLVFRDVTEQIKTEKELIKIKKLESVGVLAGGIAHDFNNILGAVLGNINLALFDRDLKDKTRNLLSAAEKASLRARDLTHQLLTFAKGGEPVKETSSLENVIKDSANFVLHGDKVACLFEIPPDLWLVDIDKGQISQVIQNIVLNAAQAMSEGGIIRIDCENVSPAEERNISLLTKGNYVKISIEDTGMGIPAGVIDKIFDPYFSTKHGGSGLGLAISQSIIRKHGGQISARSVPGMGSTFTIYLPATSRATSRTTNRNIGVFGCGAVKAKILVMDDDEMVRNVAKAMLLRMGHEVVLASEGTEAVKLFQESANSGTPIGLIIMDLTIPGGMGGKEAVREVHDIDPKTKIIVASGYSNDPIMANFRDYGFCAAIAKPFRLKDLSKAISQAFES